MFNVQKLLVMNENLVLTKESVPSDIERYFRGVLALDQQDNEFSVNLDDVWQLCYPRKDHAVRELKANFIENVDFIVIPKNGENPQGGRPKDDYYLTSACLEYFVARKVRPVFEVYRRVFHHTAAQIQQSPSQPKLSDKIQAAKFLAKFLNLNDASKLQIAKTIADPLGLPTPDYVMDEKTVHAAKDLLASHNVKMSSAEFNKILVSKGIVERMTRPGKGGKTHSWAVIPEKYSCFGQNARNPHAQNQTQALWYDNKFSELLALAGIQEGKEEESHD